MNKRNIAFLLLIILLYVPSSLLKAQDLAPVELTCEYQVNPLAIDEQHPRLSWVLSSRERSSKQTAYELLISDGQDDILHLKGNTWNSGKVFSDQNILIACKGKLLRSFTRYYWRVRVYDQHGHASPWSGVQWFETAMLYPGDWKAQWIGDGRRSFAKEEDFYKADPMPLFRKAFYTPKKVRSARLYISGLGYYEAYINGERVGDHVLDPGWTNYSKQVLYSVYDITAYLQHGDNAVGIMLGKGWYDPLPLRMWGSRNLRAALTTGLPCVKAQLRITFTDGSGQTIITDNTWKAMPGPVIRNNIYLGEQYDARLEQSGWTLPAARSNDLKGLKDAVPVQGPLGKLSVQMQPPVKVLKAIHPVSMTEPEPGTYVFDMGQNIAGIARIHVQGPAGTEIILRYAEDLYKDGRINVMTSVAGQVKSGNGGPGAPKIAWQEDRYILKGKGTETWAPRFTFHGFRYVEVSGWPGKPDLLAIEGLSMGAAVKRTGTFISSNPMFNRLFENIGQTFRNNLFSVQSDCPAREKFGYGGDLFCTCNAFMYDFDMANFYRKTLQDDVNDQRPAGGFTETAPYVGIADSSPGDQSGPLGFQIGFSYLVQQLYDFYGDQKLIAQYYEPFKRQVEFLRKRAGGYLIDTDLGDHESLEPPAKAFTASAFYYHHIKLIASFDSMLHKTSDAALYTSLADSIKQAILRKFYDAGTGKFDNGTQSAQAFGLWYELVNGKQQERSLKILTENIEQHKGHLTTGIFGTKMMLDVLRLAGRNDMAYQVADQRDFPGWGYMIAQGATTLWETWAYSDNVYSQDHPMFGSVNEWFYRSILGINALEPGFKKVLIKPEPVAGLSYAKGSYRSVQGRIISDWKIKGKHFFLHVEIPANTTAEIWVPASNIEGLTEGGRAVKDNPDIHFRKMEAGYAVLDIGSGIYRFETDYANEISQL